MKSRRDVLGALGTAAIASAAGCLSMIGGDGDGTEPTSPSGYDWLGSETADVQWLADPSEDDIRSFDGVFMQSPATAANNEYLEWDGGKDEPLQLPIEDREIALDVEPSELYVTDMLHQFSIYTGSFDTDTVSGEFADATTHDEYRDHEVVTEPAPGRENPLVETDEVYRGVAFDDRNLVIAHVAPSESRAAEFVHAMLDTEAGAAARLVETNEDFETVADELGQGWHTGLYQIGPHFDRPTGHTIELDGDTATRRAIMFYKTEDEAADSWWLDEERLESLQEPHEDESGAGIERRIAENESEDYTTLDSRREGRYVVLEATLPTEEIVSTSWSLYREDPPDEEE